MAAASIVSAFCFGQTPDLSPPPEMKKLDWMVGEWTSTGVWTMPDMGPMNVTSTFKAEWDGQFLKQTAVSDFDGMMKMTESFYLGFDPEAQKYVSYAFTNFSPTARIERGTLKGDVLTMVSDPWMVMGDKSVSRATLTKVSADEVMVKLEFETDGTWTVVTEMSYKRKKS